MAGLTLGRITRGLVLRLLFCAGLLLGQTAAIAHASQHELSTGAAHACAICLVAHAAGSPPQVQVFALQAQVAAAPTIAPLPSLLLARRACRPLGTGPPSPAVD